MADPTYRPPFDALLSVVPVTVGGAPQLPADELAAVAPELAVRGPDGEVWGVDAERVAVALWTVARTLQAELSVERKRSQQLDRRTRWLYEHVTGQQLPEDGET